MFPRKNCAHSDPYVLASPQQNLRRVNRAGISKQKDPYLFYLKKKTILVILTSVTLRPFGYASNCGHGSLVVKVTDSWLVCHEFEPSTVQDSSCRGMPMHVEYGEARMSSYWCGVEVRRGGVPAQVSSSPLDHGSKLRVLSPKVLVWLNSVTLIFNRYASNYVDCQVHFFRGCRDTFD
ncbi:hypothetical protein TNCV_1149321 [Trichonephila clavipes]|nr:hypothetical protein TNCV_1149321 [Trichonephila clavipes]